MPVEGLHFVDRLDLGIVRLVVAVDVEECVEFSLDLLGRDDWRVDLVVDSSLCLNRLTIFRVRAPLIGVVKSFRGL